MQFNAVISNVHHPEYGVMTIPFPIPSEQYDDIVEMLNALEIGDAVKRDCGVDEVRDGWPVLKQLERTTVNLDELDYLAKRLDSFDEYEAVQFQAATAKLGIHGAAELINLTFCCQEATVITDFSNLDKVGRRHYLTLGGGASMDEMQGIDFQATAKALIDHEVGSITPFGVIYENGMEMSNAYNGRSFPEYRYADCLMVLEMRSRFATEVNPSTYLYLPMTKSQIERTMHRAGIDSYDDMSLSFMESEFPEEVDVALDFRYESLGSLNNMCEAISALEQSDREKLGAAVVFAKPDCANEITELAKNLELFDFIPKVRTREEYGKYMIIESGHFEYDENLVGYFDFARYGADRMEKEYGAFTDRGYISYHGTLSIDELMFGNQGERLDMQMGYME